MTDHHMTPSSNSTTIALRPDNTLLTRPNIAASPRPRSPARRPLSSSSGHCVLAVASGQIALI